jgi:hypothetical protein
VLAQLGEEAGEPDEPSRVRRERQADRLVLGRLVPHPQAQVDPTAGDRVQGGDVPGQQAGVPEAVVQHVRAQPDPLGDRGRGRQGDERRAGADVIGGADDVEPGRLRSPGRGRRGILPPVQAGDVHPEPDGFGPDLDIGGHGPDSGHAARPGARAFRSWRTADGRRRRTATDEARP